MSLIRWSPMWDPMNEVEEMINRLPALAGQTKSFMPAMDIYETAEAVVVETPLAGVNPEAVKVSVENGILTIRLPKADSTKSKKIQVRGF